MVSGGVTGVCRGAAVLRLWGKVVWGGMLAEVGSVGASLRSLALGVGLRVGRGAFVSVLVGGAGP